LQPVRQRAISARTQGAAFALQTVNQATVDISQVHPQLALAEIVPLGVGRAIACQVQDTDIHRRNRRPGRIALPDAVHLQHCRHRAARSDLIGGQHFDVQPVIAGINRGPAKADRTRRVMPGGDIHRPDHRCRHIGTGTPLVGDV
jgi:hypothetical protein